MEFTTLHFITFLGNHYVGKSKLIKNLVSGKHLHPMIPTINKDTTLININNKFYKYKLTPWTVLKSYKHIKRIAYIVVNTSIADSVNSIPFWFNKISSNHTDIFIILINKEKDSTANLILLHHVIQFCTLHNIKLINFN